MLLELVDVGKTYARGPAAVAALEGVHLALRPGELAAIEGPSGSGKSTLLSLMGLLDRPSCGQVRLDGQDMAQASVEALARARNEKIGFVFQAFHLLPRLTAIENVALPLFYRGVAKPERLERAAAALQRVGLAARAGHRPDELSGGERQRVAIARALVGEPRLILADEPTGALDSLTADEIIGRFEALNRELGVTVVIVTHDRGVAARCPRRIQLRDGRIVADRLDAAAAE